MFKKFGKLLSTTEKPILSLAIPDNYKRLEVSQWPKRVKFPDPFNNTDWKIRSQSNFWDPCIVCGSEDKIEMHHIKHIRKTNTKLSGFSLLMSKLNRKQIPVCRPCHNKIHEGKYDGLGINNLALSQKPIKQS